MAASTPTFVWLPADGAAKYKLEVSVHANFAVIYDTVTTNNCRYTPTKAYDIGPTYYWRVQMIDDDGRYGSSETRSVVVNPFGFAVYVPRVSRR